MTYIGRRAGYFFLFGVCLWIVRKPWRLVVLFLAIAVVLMIVYGR